MTTNTDQITDKLLVTSPHLICLDKTDHSLTFSHFGNVVLYNSMMPDLVLKILKKAKSPKRYSVLAGEITEFRKTQVRKELERLLNVNYITAFESKVQIRKRATNHVLSKFVKNQEALRALTEKIENTKVGVVDLCNVYLEVNEHLKSVGFKFINEDTAKTTDLGSEFLRENDFFIVVGTDTQKYLFSKVNQILHQNGKKWLLVIIDHFGGVVGPTMGVSGGPCYDCLMDHAKRQHDHKYSEAAHTDLIEGTACEDLSDSFMVKNIFAYVGIEAIKIVSLISRPMTFDGFYSFDLYNFRMKYDFVRPSVQCPTCIKAFGDINP